MNPNWYLIVLKRYAEFNGRARRAEYWNFFLVNVLISLGLSIIGLAIKFPLLGNLYGLAVMLPGIGVAIRRMHDIDKSGWYILIPFYNLYLLTIEGDKGENQYGSDPKIDETLPTAQF